MTKEQLIEKLDIIDEFSMCDDTHVFWPYMKVLESDLKSEGIKYRIEDRLICVYFEDNI